jgi:hypothetical protein
MTHRTGSDADREIDPVSSAKEKRTPTSGITTPLDRLQNASPTYCDSFPDECENTESPRSGSKPGEVNERAASLRRGPYRKGTNDDPRRL